MNILQFIKYSTEEYKAVKKEKKIEKLEDEIARLIGEITGLQEKYNVYERVSPRLMFSNHLQRGKMIEQISIKTARKVLLVKRLQRLKEPERN